MAGAPGGSDQAFTWPPRPLETADPGRAGPENTAANDTAHVAPGDTPTIVTRPVSLRRRPRVRAPRGFWASIEAGLLGGSGGDLLEGWQPDPAALVCPRCGDAVGRGEADASGCSSCRGKRLAWDHAIRLGLYAGDLRMAIMACKYHRDRRAGRALAGLLASRVAGRLGAHGIDPADVMVVPVPTTTRRRLANGGLDHTMILAAAVGRAIASKPVRLLERRHTPHQAGLSADARARNVAGTIRVRGGLRRPTPAHVVLVDDVRTTGATASACIAAMKKCFGDRRKKGAGIPCFWLATAAVSSRRRPTGGEIVSGPAEGGSGRDVGEAASAPE